MVRFYILDYPVFLSLGPHVLLVADVSVTVVSCIVASVTKTSVGPDHPGWKCIGGGTHGPYHPAQGGQGR
jgi:hypothetical protein